MVVTFVVSEKILCLNFDQSETSIVRYGLVWSPIRKKNSNLVEDLLYLIPTNLQPIWL